MVYYVARIGLLAINSGCLIQKSAYDVIFLWNQLQLCKRFLLYQVKLLYDINVRFRTAINVLGDSIGAGLVYHLSKDELAQADFGKPEVGGGGGGGGGADGRN